MPISHSFLNCFMILIIGPPWGLARYLIENDPINFNPSTSESFTI